MGYSAFLKPRQETISEEGIEGIIDLANLKDESGTKIEARPDDFFQLTYSTSDVRKVLDEINLRFSSSKESSGLFLFEGLKGSGKSHLLLMEKMIRQALRTEISKMKFCYCDDPML